MIFVVPDSQTGPMTPMAFRAIPPPMLKDLEVFLGCSVESLRCDGKPGDISAHLGTIPAAKTPGLARAEQLVDTVETMWTVQAMKERHFDSWMSDLVILHESQEKELKKAKEFKPSKDGSLTVKQVRARNI